MLSKVRLLVKYALFGVYVNCVYYSVTVYLVTYTVVSWPRGECCCDAAAALPSDAREGPVGIECRACNLCLLRVQCYGTSMRPILNKDGDGDVAIVDVLSKHLNRIKRYTLCS